MNKLYDLKLVIDAIRATRNRWIATIEGRMAELKKDNPKLKENELFSRALAYSEVNEEFQNLITLYGIIGSDAEAYSKALAKDVVYDTQVIKLPKKAA